MKDHIVLQLSDYTATSRYKAEVRILSPELARSTLLEHDRCFVGISLDNPNFLGPKLQSIVDWISNRYSNCIFLLGDNVHRHTLRLRKSLNDEQSYHHALGLGDYYLRTHGHMLKHSLTGESFTIIRGSDIHSNPKVRAYIEQLETQFATNPDFKSAVKSFALQFVARFDDDLGDDEEALEAVRHSCQYVLEELGETCYMISLGHRVLAYPGSLAIFQQIADGVFADLPEELDQLINVGLRLKRRGKKPAVAKPKILALS